MIISKSLAEALTKVGFDYRVTFTAAPEPHHPDDFDINLFHPGKSIARVQGWVRKTDEGWVMTSRYQYNETSAWLHVKNNTYPSAEEALLALHAALYEIKCEIGEEVFEGEEGEEGA